MAELLGYERRRRIRIRQRAGLPGVLTVRDFDEAWEESWSVMVTERAWPHYTPERRGWRAAQEDEMVKDTMMRMFLAQDLTAFEVAMGGLRDRITGQRPIAGEVGAVC